MGGIIRLIYTPDRDPGVRLGSLRQSHPQRQSGDGFSGRQSGAHQQNTYRIPANSSEGAASIDPNGYWNPRTYQLLNLVSRSVVTGQGPGAVTEYTYDNGGDLTTANITQVRQWDSTKGVQTELLTAANAVIVNNTWDGIREPSDEPEPARLHVGIHLGCERCFHNGRVGGRRPKLYLWAR